MYEFKYESPKPNREAIATKYYAVLHFGFTSPRCLEDLCMTPDQSGYYLLHHDKEFPKHVQDVSEVLFQVNDNTSATITKQKGETVEIECYNVKEFMLNTYVSMSQIPYKKFLDFYRANNIKETVLCSGGIDKIRKALKSYDRKAADMVEFKTYIDETSPLLQTIESVLKSKNLYVDCIDRRFPSGYRTSNKDLEGKGEFGRRCNVNACQLENSAFFYNDYMRHDPYNSHYCFHCAKQLQDAARERPTIKDRLPFDDAQLRKAYIDGVYEMTGEEKIKEGKW